MGAREPARNVRRPRPRNVPQTASYRARIVANLPATIFSPPQTHTTHTHTHTHHPLAPIERAFDTDRSEKKPSLPKLLRSYATLPFFRRI